MSLASELHAALTDSIAEWNRTRKPSPPAVRVTLASSESFFVLKASVVGEYIALDVYPPGKGDAVLAKMVEGRGDLRSHETPRVMVVHPSSIAMIDLLKEAPDEGAIGFGAVSE